MKSFETYNTIADAEDVKDSEELTGGNNSMLRQQPGPSSLVVCFTVCLFRTT